jgi:hypothetical protein
MISKLQVTEDDIVKLGESRKTIHEQRMVLMKVSVQINDIIKSAVKGYYESSFFGPVNMEAAVDAKGNIRRFRAVVQHLNIKFSDGMRLRGHKYAVGVGPGDDDMLVAETKEAQEELAKMKDDDDLSLLPKPKILTRKEATTWVKKTLERSRGYELPGTFQPMLISQLFWEQSAPWENIALEHITQVTRVYKEFVYAVLQHTAPAEFLSRVTGLTVDAALKDSLEDAKEELKKILADKARHPMTYNRKYIPFHHWGYTNIDLIRLFHHYDPEAACPKASKDYQRSDQTC